MFPCVGSCLLRSGLKIPEQFLYYDYSGIIHLIRTQNFPKNYSISYPLIRARMRAYQGVRNVSFSENFASVLNEWSLIQIQILSSEAYLGANKWSVMEFFVKVTIFVRKLYHRCSSGSNEPLMGLLKPGFKVFIVNIKAAQLTNISLKELRNYNRKLCWCSPNKQDSILLFFEINLHYGTSD